MTDSNGYMPMPGDTIQMYCDLYTVVRCFDVVGTLMAVYQAKEGEDPYVKLLSNWNRCFEILNVKPQRRKIVQDFLCGSFQPPCPSSSSR